MAQRRRREQIEEALRKERIGKYGPSSERLSNLQLQLLEEEPGVTAEEVEAEAARARIAEPSEQRDRRKAHPGRQRLPEKLPRVEEVVAVRNDTLQRQCGAKRRVIGYDESEQLDVEPARYFVRVIKREKRACR